MTITTAFCDIHPSTELVPAGIETRSTLGDVNRSHTARCSNPCCNRNYTRGEGYFDVVVPGPLDYGDLSSKLRCGWNHFPECMVLTMMDGMLIWACPNETCRVVKPYGSTSPYNIRPAEGSEDRVYRPEWGGVPQYRVVGLPPGEDASIACMPDGYWTLLRTTNNVQLQPSRGYAGLSEALDALTTIFIASSV